MSLIPAKHYYGEDNSVSLPPYSASILSLTAAQDQWQKKKQTKEERKRAKKAKLDPASYKSAKDVLDENERKRKRELEAEEESLTPEDASLEKPKEGMKKQKPKRPRKDITRSDDETVSAEPDSVSPNTSTHSAKAEKVRLRREKKKERKLEQRKLDKVSGADALTTEEQAFQSNRLTTNSMEEERAISGENIPNTKSEEGVAEEAKNQVTTENKPLTSEDTMYVEDQLNSSSISSSPHLQSSSVSTAGQSPSSLPSSIVPPKSTEEPAERVTAKLPKIDSELLKSRLQARIEALRAARKADGIDGKPAKNRQELMEARRRKEKLRRDQKKELKAKARLDEAAAAEAELARLRGSGSPSSLDIFSPRQNSNVTENNFSFGRVSFNDGQQVNSSLSSIADIRKKKGPQDPRTALQALEKKQDRIMGMDEKKRTEIEEKDRWLSAKMKAHGEPVRDNKSLLKKTLKRKETVKARSELKWKARLDSVQKAQDSRQKKREENLKKRKDEKGAKGKKGKNAFRRRKGRPGFEGSFRARTK